MAMIMIPLILLGTGLIGVLAVSLYLALYRRYINRRLAEGRNGTGSMVVPIVVLIIVLVGAIMLSAVITISLIVRMFVAEETFVVPAEPGVYEESGPVSMGSERAALQLLYSEDLENSPFSGYTEGGEIPGYTRYETTDGDITFYYYIVNGNMEGILPRVLVSPADSCGDNATERLFSVKVGDRDSMYGDDNGIALFALRCDGFSGRIAFDEYIFTKDQQDLTEAMTVRNEDYFNKASIKGELLLDMN